MSRQSNQEILCNYRDTLQVLETRPHAALNEKSTEWLRRYFRRRIAELEDAIARETEVRPSV